MKRALLAALVAVAFGFTNGCCWNCHSHHCQDPCKPGLFHRNACSSCGESRGLFHRCRGLGHHHRAPASDAELGYGAPPSAQITYPYYTNRGPRDFLAEEPRGIGP